MISGSSGTGWTAHLPNLQLPVINDAAHGTTITITSAQGEMENAGTHSGGARLRFTANFTANWSELVVSAVSISKNVIRPLLRSNCSPRPGAPNFTGDFTADFTENRPIPYEFAIKFAVKICPNSRRPGGWSGGHSRAPPGIVRTAKEYARKSLDIYYHGSITWVVTLTLPVNRPQVHRLGDLQLQIMKLLWQTTEATVAEIHQQLPQNKELAYTTIATMLRKMEGRGLVKHRLEGRSFVYRAAVREEAVTRGMADHLVDRLFAGRLTDVVSHLLSTREVNRAELLELERLIARRKKDL